MFAYLIIAHNEFEVLRLLVEKIDDEKNDVFIHFDKKIKELPNLSTKYSKLYILDDRIDVRWGTVRQIEAEYKLFEFTLTKGVYDRYCLISGTHLPLKSKAFIDAFWMDNQGKELLRIWPEDYGDADFKLRRYHFGIENFNNPKKSIRWIVQHFWTVNLKVQKKLGIRQMQNESFLKSDNWVFLTDKAVRKLVEEKDRILKKYKFSFCGDEYFVATELSAHPEQFTIVNVPNLLYVDFVGANPRSLALSEYESLCRTDYLFARKFTSNEQ